jgi:hypothetical protein
VASGKLVKVRRCGSAFVPQYIVRPKRLDYSWPARRARTVRDVSAPGGLARSPLRTATSPRPTRCAEGPCTVWMGDDGCAEQVSFRRRAAGKKSRVRLRVSADESDSDGGDGVVAARPGATARRRRASEAGEGGKAGPRQRVTRASSNSGYVDDGDNSACPDVAGAAGRGRKSAPSPEPAAAPYSLMQDCSAADMSRLVADSCVPVLRGPDGSPGMRDVSAPAGEPRAQSRARREFDARGGYAGGGATNAPLETAMPLASHVPLCEDTALNRDAATAASGLVPGGWRRPGDAGVESDDGSAGSAWELEQLRRAGQGPSATADVVGGAATSRARAVVDEEGRLRGGRGEVGQSVAETCADNAAARVGAARDRVSRLRAEVEAVDAAQRRGVTEVSAVNAAAREAAARRDYYRDLLQYSSDVTEMLAETAASTCKRVNDEVDRLGALALARASAVDEFGRARRVQLDLERDGYDTPSGGLTSGWAPREGGGDGVEGAECGTDDDPLAGVADEFKSVPAIVARFVEWKTQFPSDYVSAYGDLLLGQLCGAVALAARLPDGLGWLGAVPKAALGAAVIKSRASPWTALNLAATWEPQSVRSSASHAASIQRVCDSLIDHAAELTAARDSFGRAAVDTLRWKTDALNSPSSAACGEAWLARAAVKCARGTALVAHACGEASATFDELESAVLNDLMGVHVCRYVKRGPSDGTEFLLWAVEDGCSGADRPGSQFPRAAHAGWAPVRGLLLRARGQVDEHRLQSALRRAGGRGG